MRSPRRFNVLFHETPSGAERGSHWDFLVEAGEALWTWAVDLAPDSLSPQRATRLPDHRLVYLDYEGPLSDDRGDVTCWDQGECEVDLADSERIFITVCGAKLNGRVKLLLQDAEQGVWEFVYDP